MRILHAHTRYRQRGGEDHVVAAERSLLEEIGCQVVPLDAANAPTSIGAAAQMAVAPWNPASFRQTVTAVASTSPDIIHVHNTWFALSPAVLSAARRTRIPVVMTLHNYRITCAASTLIRDGKPCHECVGRAGWAGVRYACYRGSTTASAIAALSSAFLRRSAGMVSRFAVLTDFAADIVRQAGIPPDRIRVIPNFVADPGPRLNEPGDSSYVLFVGRLSPEKGIDVLLEAWRRIDTGLRLVVVGDGPTDCADVRGVEFLGRRSSADTARLMLEARALLFPSQVYEGQPLVLLEAMAAGLPTLAADWPPIADTLGSGAHLVPPDDIDAWVEAIESVESGKWLSNEALRGRSRYEARHTPVIAGQRLLDLYREAMESPAAQFV